MFDSTDDRIELDLGLFMSSAALGQEVNEWEPSQIERYRAWQLMNPGKLAEDATIDEIKGIRYGGVKYDGDAIETLR